MKKLLEISHLKKSFGDTEVLKDISMEVNEGEVVAILGPSGSGKSTLLRCATLLETMDAGTLKLGGETACEDKDGVSVYVGKKELREIKNTYGLVFQNFNLFPHYTVMKNVTDAPVCVQKRDRNEVEKEARELLKKVGLDGKEDSYPCQLSGGQQQRVEVEQRRQEAIIDYDIDEYDERLLRHLALGYTKEMITNLKGMPFGVKSIEKRQNELVNRLFRSDERTGVNACRLVTRAFELRILDIDNLEPDEE